MNPLQNAAENGHAMGRAQANGYGVGNGTLPGQRPPRRQQTGQKQRQQARQAKTRQARTRTTNKTRTREFHIHINKTGGDDGDAEFLSAGHVRAFAEKGRRAMRQAAIDLTYAHEALRAVLREVPPPQGEGRGQMFMKANRTARNLKRAATAAQAASAHCARLWPAFMREYEPWLNAYGGPRKQPRKNINFGA